MKPEDLWHYYGQQRPPFAVVPGPGQESVWDYPRPPRLDTDTRCVEVHAGGTLIARSQQSLRVCETASPPTFYVPRRDVQMALLQRAPGRSNCEWKGAAEYWCLVSDPHRRPVAWSYEAPLPAFAALRGALAFYPERVACTVAGESVKAQSGGFYGGWITAEIVGPFKGDPGTGNW